MSLRTYTPSTPSSRRLSSQHRPHGVALSCKWSLADSYPDIDKFTRGVERFFAETHFTYSTHSERKDEWSWLSRDGVSTNNSSDWTEGGRGKSIRGKATAGPSTLPIFIYRSRLTKRGAARYTEDIKERIKFIHIYFILK